MCGIWGMVALNNSTLFRSEVKLLKPLTLITALRGEHGTGLFSVSSTKDKKDPQAEPVLSNTWLKIGSNLYDFWQSKAFLDWIADEADDLKTVWGHGRHATKGSHSTDNAHPFQHKHITMIHNGTLDGGYVADKDGTDSEAVCKMIAQEGYVPMLKKVWGAYVFVWYDSLQKKLRIVKNDKRPLYYLKCGPVMYFASEAVTLKFLREREFTASEINMSDDIKAVENETLYEFNMEGATELSTEKVEVKKFHTTSHHTSATKTGGTKSAQGLIQYTNSGHTHGPNSSTKNAFPYTLKGKDVCFVPATTTDVKKTRVYFGTARANGYEMDNMPVMFKSHNLAHFDALFDEEMLVGTIVGIEKVHGLRHLVVKARSIQAIDLIDDPGIPDVDDDQLDIETVTLKNGDKMGSDTWITAATKGCLWCGVAISDEEAESCTLGYGAASGTRIICPDCTDTITELKPSKELTS